MKTKMITTISLLALLTVCFTGLARADWNPGDPYKMHYPQLPDLQFTGLDVLANYPYPGGGTFPFGKVLADDWKCTSTGPVSDIHIWGSWWEDILPQTSAGIADPGAVTFKLSIHEDIPAVIAADGTVLEHSRPGALLWMDFFSPGDPRWKTRLYANNVQEQFYDPNLDEIVGTDTQVWQYNFFIDPDTAFVQKQGTIYWLDVMAIPDEIPGITPAVWGWKTSREHWNDDAVWGDTPDPIADPDVWNELRYPFGHPLYPQSIDLSFVITPEPATLAVLGLGMLAALLARSRRTK